MYKRLFGKFVTPVIIVLALLLIGTSAVNAAGFEGYKDVKENDDHYEGIKSLSEQGIMTGYEDETFRQWNELSRQHVAVILFRTNGLSIPENVDEVLSVYNDVDSSHEYAAEIAAVTEAGFFKGNQDGKFTSTKSITREQMASVLVRAIELENVEASEEVAINLSNVDESHQAGVQILANLALTNQLSDYRPKQAISRGAVASLLHRALQVVEMEPGELENFHLSVMHMNDTHARVDKMPKMVTAIKEMREEKPDSLLLHGGDIFSGTLYFTEFEGRADVALFNLMDFDAVVFGNHEFDLGDSENGHASLANLIEKANFPFLGTNIDFSGDELLNGFVSDTPFTGAPEAGNVYGQIVKEVDGEKIGIFGLTTEDTKDIASPVGVKFLNYISSAKKSVEAFEEAGVNKIIALNHIGFDSDPTVGNDLLLAAAVDGIDMIIGGHSHTALTEPVVIDTDAAGNEKDPTIIVQAGEYVNNLGTLDVEFNEEGIVVGHAGELIKIGDQVEDAEAAEVLKEFSPAIEELMTKESGAVATKELTNPRQSEGEVGESVRATETALGNLITDGMLSKALEYDDQTVIAMQNGGGIRTSIPEGPITIGNIIEVLPFGNTLSIIELSGAEIKTVLEHSVSNAPRESGGFIHVSGMKFTYDSSQAVGDRVQEMHVKQGDDFVEIVETEKYSVTTNAFTARGGDGFDMLKQAYEDGRVRDLGLSDWENLRDHMVELGTVDPEIEGRIIDLADK